MPTLSVTLIALLVAAATAWYRKPSTRALVGALIGAWAGFVVGALVGVLIDATTGSGHFLAYVGHASAAAGAVIGVSRATHPRRI